MRASRLWAVCIRVFGSTLSPRYREPSGCAGNGPAAIALLMLAVAGGSSACIDVDDAPTACAMNPARCSDFDGTVADDSMDASDTRLPPDAGADTVDATIPDGSGDADAADADATTADSDAGPCVADSKSCAGLTLTTCNGSGTGSTKEVCGVECSPTKGCLNVTSAGLGDYSTCALLSDKTVRCWGDNSFGQLGDGSFVAHLKPAEVPGLADVANIGINSYGPVCARIADNSLRCWGRYVGDGSTTRVPTPTLVVGLAATEPVAALFHGCARRVDGSVSCWGENTYGQLGDGTTTNRFTPGLVSSVTGVTRISAHPGGGHTCVLATGTLKCWGANFNGQIGDDTTTAAKAPVTIGLPGVTDISAGWKHTCALMSDATAKCWGANDSGQLGDGTKAEHRTPTTVPGLAGALAVIAGGDFSCALLTGGTVKCWGSNVFGQIGDGTNDDRLTPTPVTGLSGVAKLRLGQSAACAIVDNGLKCWGKNTEGLLGDGTKLDRSSPTAVRW